MRHSSDDAACIDTPILTKSVLRTSQTVHKEAKQDRRVRGGVTLQISRREFGDIAVVDLCGRSIIDAGASELLSAHLKKWIGSGMRKLLLNLVDLTQVDSSGVAVIVGAYVSLKRQGGDLKLLCPNGRVLEVLTVCHLLDIIPSFADEAEALASFGPQT